MKLLAHALVLLVVVLAFTSGISFAQADLRPDKVYLADAKKNFTYIKDGLITGGDAAVDEFIVKDIRRASNAGYERVVVDLEGNRNGEPVAISRAPYFQVSVTPDERRLIFTFFGKPRIAFDSRRVVQTFKKSAQVENLVLLPTLEEKSWTFAVEMKAGRPVEVFELTSPVRVIMDIKTDPKAEAKNP